MSRHFFKKSFLTFITFASPLALFATNLSPMMDIPSAKVLPKGVRNLRYKGVFAKVDRQYNELGHEVQLADTFFKNVSWRDMVKVNNKDDTLDKINLQSLLEKNHVNLDESVGESTGDIHISNNVHVPVFAYGFTDELTVAIAVPVSRYRLNVDTGFSANENFTSRVDESIALESERGANKTREKMYSPISQKIHDFGYEPLKNESGTKIGDVRLVSKYQFYKSDLFLLTLQNELALPTAKRPSVNKVVDVTAGDGQWDFGVGILGDYKPLDQLTLSAGVSYTHQFGDTFAMRIPEDRKSTLSPDIDWGVERKLGDIFKVEAGAQYSLLDSVNLFTGYSLQTKVGDRYRPSSGSNIDYERYHYLEEKSYRRLSSAIFGVGYQTIELYKQKKFPVPFEAKLTYSKTLEGMNVKTDPSMVSMDFSLFF